MSEEKEYDVPDPEGPPVRSEFLSHFVRFAGWTAFTLVGSATAFLIFAATPTRTMGALRSHRLKVEQRKAQIDDVVANPQPAAEAEVPHD
ncbi:MAG TPA: hypothetical protein VHM90_00770 [Phycisphaerae bacterium]|nr:hypothetical protein [Phycisphaerae bacterium]